LLNIRPLFCTSSIPGKADNYGLLPQKDGDNFFKKGSQPLSVTEMFSSIPELPEQAGYAKHTLCGNMYGSLKSVSSLTSFSVNVLSSISKNHCI
jgi:hypothetical protein